MWPFKRTLSERYSKLVKLIKSIDPNFQMTENKEDSLRLHLPNYKGNQPMDFHIYLMEPFLFISFITEIEGEKISCLNNFPQDTDQQDMFNLAMSNNLNKIHQVLEDKYSEDGEEKKEDGKEETDGNHNSVTSNNDSSDETWGLRDYYDFNESFKKHALTIMILRRGIEFRYFASKNDYNPIWSYIINGGKTLNDNYPPGAEPFVWIMKHYDNQEVFCWLLEVLDEQIAHLWVESMEEPEKLINDIQKYVPQFKLKNNPQNVKVNIGWSWIDIHAILHFIDYCSKPQNKPASKSPKVKPLLECSNIEDLSILYWSDSSKEQHSQKEKEKKANLNKKGSYSEPDVIESRKSNIFLSSKETNSTSIYYIAVAIDMVIAVTIGVCVYFSNLIHLEQDRMLFLIMCFLLALAAWGYPYFEKSVKIDNDGCFEQGCIHPIIGVFGFLFFPLFIHYWIYKGIKFCIKGLKYDIHNSDDKDKSFICDACGKTKYGHPRTTKVQYNYKNSGIYHHYNYRQCKICRRCWILRFVSIIVGIVAGCLYCILFAKMMETDSVILGLVYILLLNPLFVGVFIGIMFRMFTNCDVELDKNANIVKKKQRKSKEPKDQL